MPKTEERSFQNVIRRLSNLLAMRGNVSIFSREQELKAFWMPDSISKECYDCGDKFTTFRRRHHCRICGQIFCSRCCNLEISGNFMGFTGNLRVCLYCHKVGQSYLSSSNVTSIPIKYSNEASNSVSSIDYTDERFNPDTRATGNSGFHEERYIIGSLPYEGLADEKLKEWASTINVESLIHELFNPMLGGLILQNNRYKNRNFPQTFIGVHLVDWLLSHKTIKWRAQGGLIGDLLLKRKYIQCLSHNEINFIDDYVIYQPTELCTDLLLKEEQTSSESEPLWVSLIELDENTSREEELQASNINGNSQMSSNADYSVKVDLSHNVVSLSTYQTPASDVISDEAPILEDVKCAVEPPSLFDKNIEDHLCPAGLNTTLEYIHQTADRKLSIDKIQEMSAFTQLERSFLQHFDNLTKQLLTEEGLGFVWLDIVKDLAVRTIDIVNFDAKGKNDAMDIRCYIKVKKVPGGSKTQSQIVNGLVCTKQVARKQMKRDIIDPKIMALSSSIMYGRNESKLLGFETLILQESEYLRNIVNKVVSFKPDVLIVEKTVSRLAEDLLHEAGVTLVKNVKISTIESLNRFTQVEIISSIDSLVTQPILGTCGRFHLVTYTLRPKVTKTLMFFDDCPQGLGCSIILRGASYSELAKVKKVLLYLIFVCCNWVSESAFLCNECATLPTLNDSTDEFEYFLAGKSKSGSSVSHKDFQLESSSSHSLNSSFTNEKRSDCISVNSKETDLQSTSETLVDSNKTYFEESFISLENGNESFDSRLLGPQTSSVDDLSIRCELVDDHSDPLHLYLNSSIDEVPSNKESSISVSSVPSNSRKFVNCLDDVLLSISPHIKFPPPYLETEKGKKLALRQFLPREMFWSKHFSKCEDTLKPELSVTVIEKNVDRSCTYCYDNVTVNDPHCLINYKITLPATSNDLISILADFRAQGGTLDCTRLHRTHLIEIKNDAKIHPISPSSCDKIDALSSYNHQRISVLYCSYSYSSENFPGFCVGPWAVNMDFYGRDDITVGRFLEKYCFDPSYVCPSGVCRTSMSDHIRKFTHDKYCLQVTIKQLDETIPGAENNIIMWSWCQKCRKISPILPMREKTWGFSFAKYLELNFYGLSYQLGKQNGCDHSLHHDHYHYFGFNDIVASFKVFVIDIWEVSLPNMAIDITTCGITSQELIEDVKRLTVMGFGVFSNIFEKLGSIRDEAVASGLNTEHFDEIHDVLQEDKNSFVEKLDSIQIKLTDPLLKDCSQDSKGKAEHIYSVNDLSINLQEYILSKLNIWNTKLTELTNQKIPSFNKKITDGGNGVKKEDKANVKSKTKISSDSPSEGSDISRDIKNSESNESPCSVLNDTSLESGASESPLILTPSTAFKLKHEECLKTLTILDDIAEKQIDNLLNDSAVDVFSTGSISPQKKVDKSLTLPSEEIEAKRSSSNVKSLMSNLTSMFTGLPIRNPFPPLEHLSLPPHLGPAVVVKEDQISSVIAFTLSSVDYHRKLAEIKHTITTSLMLQGESNKPDFMNSTEISTSTESSSSKKVSMFSFLKSNTVEDDCLSTPETFDNSSLIPNSTSPLLPSKQPDYHIEIQFSDSYTKFYCRVYFAVQFRQLRKFIFPQGEEHFVRSLSLSKPWAARGGKSGSEFSKTSDDRFVIKQMSKFEIQSFRNFAPNYFSYMKDVLKNNRPTVLAKILGIYRVSYRNSHTNKETKQDVLVMENLFYRRNITQKFDLKGSLRNRLVNQLGKSEHELVLMDENFLKTICDNPLYIRPHSKLVLTSAIQSDTLFLSSQSVMDYSLLVGLDTSKKELVIGIIDYIRTFTWEKRLESVVKSSGILGGQGKLPTIVSPELYRARFCEAMMKYFLDVPDKWSGMGKGIDY